MSLRIEYVPESVTNLALELQEPYWRQLKEFVAQEYCDFVGVTHLLAGLAAALSIVLDDYYIIPDLCEQLCTEMKRRRQQAETIDVDAKLANAKKNTHTSVKPEWVLGDNQKSSIRLAVAEAVANNTPRKF